MPEISTDAFPLSPAGEQLPQDEAGLKSAGPGRTTPLSLRWAAAVATLLLAASAATAIVAARHERGVRSDESARRGVIAALTASLPAALGYDYRHLDLAKAASGLTPRFAADYKKLFTSTIAPTATKYKGVVTAEVVAMGIESADRDTAQVLAFVDQTTKTSVLPAPRVDSSRVRVKLSRVNGSWRIDAIEPL